MNVAMTLINRDGINQGTYDKQVENRIPEIVTKDDRIYVLRRIAPHKDKATYVESAVFDMGAP